MDKRTDLGVDDGLAEVGHEADERRVPLVGDLGEGRLPRRHEHLAVGKEGGGRVVREGIMI